ncbi:MAG: methyl-accepting chemotaxis protein, partial [Candidatus Thiodiazotropha sp.]|jgi:methyl-accepting chemotaxis protein
LSGKISHRFKGEFLEMAKDVEEVSSNLGAVVQRMQVEAESLANNTGMLNKTNEANIQLLEQQKSEAQNVATAMTQMTSTIQGVSDSARLAADQAVEADEMAGIGEKRVLEVIASIKQVSDDVESLKGTITQVAEHSNEIGSVIQIISGVAEQTNLLALNAAIEAARAGEQGRGFAVVAGEVRSLASKTQESTGKIREVIETLQKVTKKAVEDSDKSQIKSKETVSVAEQAGESLQRINRYIEKISMANAQIANAVKEQGLVSEEVNNNIIAISEMAERIHHGGVDTCQATNVLARMADNMNDIASQFQVNHDSNVVHL